MLKKLLYLYVGFIEHFRYLRLYESTFTEPHFLFFILSHEAFITEKCNQKS